VPLELIKEIIGEIKNTKKKIEEVNDDIKDSFDELQSKQEEKEDGGLIDIAKSDNEPQKYDVSDRHYIFYKDGKPYKVLISTVRAIFESYSREGKDLS
jgi:predicted nuclease with TOPRIM domain